MSTEDFFKITKEICYVIDRENLEGLKRLSKIYDFNRYINLQSMKTPLHVAVSTGNLEIFMWLIDNYDLACSANLQDMCGRTPLHRAIKVGNLEIIKLLFKTYDLTPSVNLQDFCGKTPLHWAVENNNSEIVKYLIEK